ncbi:hypothetical protein D554_3413 [Bordetella holmesii 30539]|uniref:N-acetyltransferase YedL n=1 Tax=Bordetella holmesii 1058 TaxID=1247648 RepID=A0ABP3BIE3_9BORD|nr:hypothetical protein D560_3519 [Bordetella holmesii ATCC 51541]AIT28128.1 hypothetical protein D558_3488 [Bordetella holmesii 44057]EWM40912.1 hypothetical protein D555_3557 [Bordetella holmesii 35009]EWM41542.1 hypothetical protein D556_3486 [Bordetella holmesii 41130]EWM44807.1 hypothetical protein D557_2796 [Bordetella holmesii 70147]EXF88136.1 hypothetical protein D554_3413 [Bordetella holmesii 30539]EXX94138.1 hypothetical protein D559_1547 [Bordetella holmesii 1058]
MQFVQRVSGKPDEPSDEMVAIIGYSLLAKRFCQRLLLP